MPQPTTNLGLKWLAFTLVMVPAMLVFGKIGLSLNEQKAHVEDVAAAIEQARLDGRGNGPYAYVLSRLQDASPFVGCPGGGAIKGDKFASTRTVVTEDGIAGLSGLSRVVLSKDGCDARAIAEYSWRIAPNVTLFGSSDGPVKTVVKSYIVTSHRPGEPAKMSAVGNEKIPDGLEAARSMAAQARARALENGKN